MTPEGAIEHEIFNFLRELGVLAFKHDSDRCNDQSKENARDSRDTNFVAGVSHVIGIIFNRPFAITVKSAKNQLTRDQRIFLRWFQDHGGIAFVARSAKDVAVEFSKHFPDEDKIKRYLN